MCRLNTMVAVLWWALGYRRGVGLRWSGHTLLMRLKPSSPERRDNDDMESRCRYWEIASAAYGGRTRGAAGVCEARGPLLSPAHSQRRLKNPDALNRKRVEINCAFNDLTKFHAGSLRNSATKIMLQLSESKFLPSKKNSAVFAGRKGRAWEKTIRDQFLAYWGAPDPQPDAADLALRAGACA